LKGEHLGQVLTVFQALLRSICLLRVSSKLKKLTKQTAYCIHVEKQTTPLDSYHRSRFTISSTDPKIGTVLNNVNKQHRRKSYPWLSGEWTHLRISTTDIKARTTLYSIINSTTGKYCSIAFI